MGRIKELEELIRYYKATYYGGAQSISDVEYDKLEDELREIDPTNPALSIIGTKVNSSIKIEHKQKMLSLQKTYRIDELEDWRAGKDVLSTNKIDGVSCSIIYKGGKFNLAKTRGDGSYGENISESIKWMSSIPTSVNEMEEIEIRGEMYCDESGFYKLSKEMETLGLVRPSSPRNIVAGIISRKDQVQLARFIKFMAFDLICEAGAIKKEAEKFEKMEQLGFEVPEYQLHQSLDTIQESIKKAKTFMIEGEYQIDGIVFAFNDIGIQNEMGATSHHPKYKIAFKFPGEIQRTKIDNISWGVSRNGVLTPVANVTPVELSGAVISRVTLHNLGVVEINNLKAGDVIEIIRSGEVIPKFMDVVEQGAGSYFIPSVCPECNEVVVQKDIRLMCENSHCRGRKREGIVYFVQKMGIDDLSYKRINTLIDAGLIKELHDVFHITKEQLLEVEKVKEKLATKIIESIEKSKKTSLLKIITALGISGGAGNKTEKIIQAGYTTIDAFLKLDIESLIKVDSFAEKSAKEYIDSLQEKAITIQKLLEAGIEIDPIKKRATMLNGQKFCITGALSRKRNDIEKEIKEAGGDIVSSVSKKTNYLVTNDIGSGSSKLNKAKDLGVTIINEAELKKMLSK